MTVAEQYTHNDVEALERTLKENKNTERKLIIDGVFSMDGDIAPLDEITDVAEEYGAMVMVDDCQRGVLRGRQRNSRILASKDVLTLKLDRILRPWEFKEKFGGFRSSEKLRA